MRGFTFHPINAQIRYISIVSWKLQNNQQNELWERTNLSKAAKHLTNLRVVWNGKRQTAFDGIHIRRNILLYNAFTKNETE